MKIKCLLVDDEPLAMDILESYIQQVPDLELVGKCESALKAYEILRQQEIDLIFLDIEMPQLNGIEFINDSKATNVVSVKYALETITKPIVWIVGGKDKGNDYSILFDLVRTKVKCIVALGKDNEKILSSFKNFGLPMKDFKDTQKAVDWAFSQSTSGDCVLLSPACSSFDLFDNYEDRGRKFKKAVANV